MILRAALAALGILTIITLSACHKSSENATPESQTQTTATAPTNAANTTTTAQNAAAVPALSPDTFTFSKVPKNAKLGQKITLDVKAANPEEFQYRLDVKNEGRWSKSLWTENTTLVYLPAKPGLYFFQIDTKEKDKNEILLKKYIGDVRVEQ